MNALITKTYEKTKAIKQSLMKVEAFKHFFFSFTLEIFKVRFQVKSIKGTVT